MHQTLHWILENEKSLNSHYRSPVDFITVRGTLVLVMCTPYAKGSYHSQWEICATKFNGTIYFSAIDTDIDKAEQTNASLKYLLCQSWGYKFEQYMTTDTIDGNPDIWSTTHQLEEYCVMLENILNSHSLLYKAEIDAVVPHRFPRPGSGDTTCYTELKTSRSLTTIAQDYNFRRYKLVAWWAQSLLAGIPEIICGMRNDNGIVHSLKIFRVNSIPNEVK
ncbi:Protein Dom3Z, partial [Stegodyphus mimosarum]